MSLLTNSDEMDQDFARRRFLQLHHDICSLLPHYSSVFDRACEDKAGALEALYGIARQHVHWLWLLAHMTPIYRNSDSISLRLIPADFGTRPLRATEDEYALYDEYARCIHRSRDPFVTTGETMQTLASIAKRHVYSRESRTIAVYPHVRRTYWS